MSTQTAVSADQSRTTPEQRRGNRRIAIGLVVMVVCIYASFIVRQWLANS